MFTYYDTSNLNNTSSSISYGTTSTATSDSYQAFQQSYAGTDGQNHTNSHISTHISTSAYTHNYWTSWEEGTAAEVCSDECACTHVITYTEDSVAVGEIVAYRTTYESSTNDRDVGWTYYSSSSGETVNWVKSISFNHGFQDCWLVIDHYSDDCTFEHWYSTGLDATTASVNTTIQSDSTINTQSTSSCTTAQTTTATTVNIYVTIDGRNYHTTFYQVQTTYKTFSHPDSFLTTANIPTTYAAGTTTSQNILTEGSTSSVGNCGFPISSCSCFYNNTVLYSLQQTDSTISTSYSTSGVYSGATSARYNLSSITTYIANSGYYPTFAYVKYNTIISANNNGTYQVIQAANSTTISPTLIYTTHTSIGRTILLTTVEMFKDGGSKCCTVRNSYVYNTEIGWLAANSGASYTDLTLLAVTTDNTIPGGKQTYNMTFTPISSGKSELGNSSRQTNSFWGVYQATYTTAGTATSRHATITYAQTSNVIPFTDTFTVTVVSTFTSQNSLQCWNIDSTTKSYVETENIYGWSWSTRQTTTTMLAYSDHNIFGYETTLSTTVSVGYSTSLKSQITLGKNYIATTQNASYTVNGAGAGRFEDYPFSYYFRELGHTYDVVEGMPVVKRGFMRHSAYKTSDKVYTRATANGAHSLPVWKTQLHSASTNITTYQVNYYKPVSTVPFPFWSYANIDSVMVPVAYPGTTSAAATIGGETNITYYFSIGTAISATISSQMSGITDVVFTASTYKFPLSIYGEMTGATTAMRNNYAVKNTSVSSSYENTYYTYSTTLSGTVFTGTVTGQIYYRTGGTWTTPVAGSSYMPHNATSERLYASPNNLYWVYDMTNESLQFVDGTQQLTLGNTYQVVGIERCFARGEPLYRGQYNSANTPVLIVYPRYFNYNDTAPV